MALPKQETFTAADQLLATYDANWVANGGVFRIVSNACKQNTSGGPAFLQHWHGDTFANTHYAKATLHALASGGAIGVAVRCNASTNNGYFFFADSTTDSYVGTDVNGTMSDIGSGRGAFADDDVIELRASATGTLQLFKNGSQIGTDISDSTFSGGYAGISGYNSSSVAELLDWEGGDLGGGAATLEQEGFRWRNDDANEASATWKAAQDTDLTDVKQSNTRLRIILNGTNDPAAALYKLEYKLSTDSVWKPVKVVEDGVT